MFRNEEITCPCHKEEKPKGVEWEERLYFEVMEDFLHCAIWAVKYEVKDKEKYYTEINEHYEKLKSLIESIRTEAIEATKEEVRMEIISLYENRKSWDDYIKSEDILALPSLSIINKHKNK